VAPFKNIYNSLGEIINNKLIKREKFVYNGYALNINFFNIPIKLKIGFIFNAKYRYPFYIIKLNKSIYLIISVI